MIIFQILLLTTMSWAAPDWQCLFCEEQTTYVYEKKGNNALVQLVADKDVALEWKSQKKTTLAWVKKISREKEKALSLVGIKKWQLQNQEWLTYSETEKLLQLSGFYIDRNNQKIYFKELHQFSGDRTLRILITSESAADLKNTKWADVSSFLKSEMSKKL